MFLLIGGDSEIGAATARHLKAKGRQVISTSRRGGALAGDQIFLDLDNLPADWRPPEGVEAACIFAAVGRLAACEADWVGSFHLNVTRSLALAKNLVASGVYTLFLSTNQVFDGNRPHVPADARHSPVSAYGRQKAAAEAVFKGWIERGDPAGVFRLAKVVSPGMPLLCSWRRSLSKREPIRAFEDMRMAPAPVALVAEAIGLTLADRTPVIAQLTGPRDVSYLEVAHFIADEVGVDRELVQQVRAVDNGMPESAVPQNTTLDSSYLSQRYGIETPEAWGVIRAILKLAR